MLLCSIDARGIVENNPENLPAEAEIALCRLWLREHTQRTIQVRKHSGTSYTLKHVVEEHAGTYVSNGAFIEAARREGLKIRRIGATLNAYFNIIVVKRKFNALECATIAGMHAEGHSLKRLCETFDASAAAIRYALRKAGV